MQRTLIKLIILLALPASANAFMCVKGEIRSIEFDKPVITVSSYCYDETKKFIVSEGCQKTKKCLALSQIEKVLPIAYNELSGPFGTPASKICHLLKGDFKIVDFKIDDGFKLSDVCNFADGSFVNGASLMTENESRHQK